jgi:hypothetical protein
MVSRWLTRARHRALFDDPGSSGLRRRNDRLALQLPRLAGEELLERDACMIGSWSLPRERRRLRVQSDIRRGKAIGADTAERRRLTTALL